MKSVTAGWLYQRGAATLLIALVLMMALTIVTISIAHTLLVEQRITSNAQWHTRLLLLADAGVARAADMIEDRVDWIEPQGSQEQVRFATGNVDSNAIDTVVLLRRMERHSSFLLVQATSERRDGSELSATVGQYLRPLTVLSPMGERTPPLVVNGCLDPGTAQLDIRPLNADLDEPGEALWMEADQDCALPPDIDAHGGAMVKRELGPDLWQRLFTVDRPTFAAMAAEHANLPIPRRVYWTVEHSDLVGGRWVRSLGTPEQPVAVHFTRDAGCPRFAPGVRIHGVVYIDAACPEPVATHGFEVYGSLAVNGSLNAGSGLLQLNHMQVADLATLRLRFPVLRSVPVPGTWSDF